MAQGTPGSGIVQAAGLSRRRDDFAAYSRVHRAANREKINAYARRYYHERIKPIPPNTGPSWRQGR